jgi:hypothetical protein
LCHNISVQRSIQTPLSSRRSQYIKPIIQLFDVTISAEESFIKEAIMKNKQDLIITTSVTNPQSLPPNSTAYGLIMRYGMEVWRYPHWYAQQYAQQSNALTLVLMEENTPVFLRRSQTGCSGVYQHLAGAFNAGMTISALLHNKHIPASIVLYKGFGYLDSDVWLSSQEHIAERAALLGSAHKLYVMDDLISELNLPIGVGMLPCSKAMQQSLNQSLYVLQDYRD